MEKNTKSKRKIIGTIIEWVLIVLAVLYVAFVAVFASKKPSNNTSSTVFGFQTRLVVSGSMEADKSYYKGKDYKVKQIKTGALVFLRGAPKSTEIYNTDNKYSAEMMKFINTISVGDVVTFIPEKGTRDSITHRVVSKTQVGDKIRFETRGDVATSAGESVVESFNAENLEGKVIGTSPFLGWMYRKVFNNKPLIATLIITPCAVIAIYEIFKIVKIIKEDKAETALENGSSSDLDENIEELEKRLEELKKKKGENK